jgi:hypothetical protein
MALKVPHERPKIHYSTREPNMPIAIRVTTTLMFPLHKNNINFIDSSGDMQQES